MADDNVDLKLLRAVNDKQAVELAALKGGGGGGTYGPMDGRVSKLEAHVDHIRDDMRDVKADLKTIIGKLGTLPTKADLSTWRWQWIAAGVALFAIIVGSIIGGLGFLASILSHHP